MATPSVRFRVALVDDRVVGYAVAGARPRAGLPPAGGRAPRPRRATASVGPWSATPSTGCAGRGARRAVVNTQEGNAAALHLYEALGFRPEPAGLDVLGAPLLDPPRPPLGLLLAATLLVLAARRAGARHGPGSPESARPRLVGQTPWVAEDQPFDLAFAHDGGLPEGGTVELTLYGALTSRETLMRGTVDPTLLGDVRDVLSIPTALVPARAGTVRSACCLATDGSTAGLPVGRPWRLPPGHRRGRPRRRRPARRW